MRTRGYLRETPWQHSSAEPGGALAGADSSCGGLWRTYARVGYAAPFNTAEHLLPPGACSALLATAGGGRAKPCAQPAPGRQASSARVPAALSQSSTRLVSAHHHHVQQHDRDLHGTRPGLGLGSLGRGWQDFLHPSQTGGNKLLLHQKSKAQTLNIPLCPPKKG